MKRLVVVILILLVLLISYIYISIPSNIRVEARTITKVNSQASFRVMYMEENWRKWWPADSSDPKIQRSFKYNGSVYTLTEVQYNSFKLNIFNGKDTIPSVISIIPINYDSTQLKWEAVTSSNWNPVQRWMNQRYSKSLKGDLEYLVSQLHNFLNKEKNIYGVNILRVIVTDTLLISIKKKFSSYPGVAEVDSLIHTLKDYIEKHGASQIGYPMLHVDMFGPDYYQAMVAIATDKNLPNDGKIEFRRMIPGYMLAAEVKGGPQVVKNALVQLQYFIDDYHRSSPAIPYELMVTDRSLETDTTKWITRIYYPIIR